jgi:hypothetical protein
MKSNSPPEPLFSFLFPDLGYTVAIIPLSLRDIARDEMIGSIS